MIKIVIIPPLEIHEYIYFVLQSAANYLVSIYPNDLVSDHLVMNSYSSVYLLKYIYIEMRNWDMFLYRVLEGNNSQCKFPNIELVLRIYSVLMVPNGSEER